MKYLDGLDSDIKIALQSQLKNLWTHYSTAIEGNSLTLGETAFVIAEGLTVSGKPIKDHQDILGHATAFDMIYKMVNSDTIDESDLFDLHKVVQGYSIIDCYKPVGAWKKEPNGTTVVDEDERQIFMEYAPPEDVPILMRSWLLLLNSKLNTICMESALEAYTELHLSFVRIHPFFDGNGRLARLLSNLPVIRSGYPPIVIPKIKRQEYISLLAKYELSVGQPCASQPLLLPFNETINQFKEFCRNSWEESLNLVREAHTRQLIRRDTINSNIKLN
ncbi:MAG: Fic family protein [Desulfamplus sp.]|nr:Fic family protein [Desulfamplus sp.]